MSAYQTPGSTVLSLQQIPYCATNRRIRFLGCITSYDHTKAKLTLSHPPSPVAIKTDVSVLVQALPMGSLKNGGWVNVIGDTILDGEATAVRAVMLWSAGCINLGKYEKALASKTDWPEGIWDPSKRGALASELPVYR